MTRKQIGLAIVAALLLSGSAVRAEQAACVPDIKKFCGDVKPGDGRLKACMKPHLTEFSDPCNDRVFTVAVTGKECKGDVTNLCAGIKPGTGGIRNCIKTRMAEVSDGCKEAMARAAAGRKLIGGKDL
jgi:hypothetical protein